MRWNIKNEVKYGHNLSHVNLRSLRGNSPNGSWILKNSKKIRYFTSFLPYFTCVFITCEFKHFARKQPKWVMDSEEFYKRFDISPPFWILICPSVIGQSSHAIKISQPGSLYITKSAFKGWVGRGGGKQWATQPTQSIKFANQIANCKPIAETSLLVTRVYHAFHYIQCWTATRNWSLARRSPQMRTISNAVPSLP